MAVGAGVGRIEVETAVGGTVVGTELGAAVATEAHAVSNTHPSINSETSILRVFIFFSFERLLMVL
jgi:hypothetical protein